MKKVQPQGPQPKQHKANPPVDTTSEFSSTKKARVSVTTTPVVVKATSGKSSSSSTSHDWKLLSERAITLKHLSSTPPITRNSTISVGTSLRGNKGTNSASASSSQTALSRNNVKSVSFTPITSGITSLGNRVTTGKPTGKSAVSPGTIILGNKETNRRSGKDVEASSETNYGKDRSSTSKRLFQFVCGICAEDKPEKEVFSIKGCTHSYCRACIAQYVASKLRENITHVSCPVPVCKVLLQPEYCRSILPKEVYDRWGSALCEAAIPGAQKFYCPFKDCSAMLIDDGRRDIKESECPHCWRLFCAQCKVPWHSGIECERFQKLQKNERGREDIMLMKLADDKRWKRCPNCRIYVERTEGCKFMKCRCGTHFCYGCGGSQVDLRFHFCCYCKS